MYKASTILGDFDKDNLKIWRYMDLGKFISLLMRGELFFVRVGILADSADLYEGALTQLNFDRPELAAEYLARMLDVPGNPPDIRDTVGRYAADPDRLLQTVDMVRRFVYVLCWHASNYESAAMWKVYVQGNEGIAIQSTVGRLKGSLNVARESSGYSRCVTTIQNASGFLWISWRSPSGSA